jgi:hypothetical protein
VIIRGALTAAADYHEVDLTTVEELADTVMLRIENRVAGARQSTD